MTAYPTRSQGARRAALALLVGALGLVAWLGLRERERPAHALELAAVPESSGAPAPTTVAPVEPDHEATRRRADEADTKTSTPTASASVDPRTAYVLQVLFVRPDGAPFVVEDALVRVVDRAGHVREVRVTHAKYAVLEGLAAGPWVLDVEGAAFEHDTQRIEAGVDPGAQSRDPGARGGTVLRERALLRPTRWFRVVVERTGGGSLEDLAAELGIEPRRLFYGAFGVVASLEAPAGPRAPGAPDPSLAVFHPPPNYTTWKLEDGACGSLHARRDPPFWARLDLFGVPLAWTHVGPAAEAITFSLEVAELEARFAALALRVVDAGTGAPVVDARVTLRADVAPHRRKEQENRPTRDDGRIELVRIVPGRYELSIARGESQDQRMIELGAGEHRDLGDVPVAASAGFDVLVVDARGQPAEAWVEIGPYAKDTRTYRIFPQMLRHRSSSDGRLRLPMPSGPAIVRAALDQGRSNREASVQELQEGARSAILHVDPRTAPTAPLRLVLLEPVAVRIQTARDDVARIDVLDELDVVVARGTGVRDVEVRLVEGRYRVRAHDAAGDVAVERELTVAGDPMTLDL